MRWRPNCLGFEVHHDDKLVCLYRAREELPRSESPKPCFAPIYTPSGGLVTEYRPADHAWHTGLYFGWVRANQANLWGGPWYLPETGKYEYVDHSHGIQRHENFTDKSGPTAAGVDEALTWLDADDQPIATEVRHYRIGKLAETAAWSWHIRTRIEPATAKLALGASRMSHYSGLELRMGPPFADAQHRCSEGRQGHENIMGQQARWVSATGAAGGAVVMMDHPSNPRHPVPWFTRKNLLGAGLLMEGDMEIAAGDALDLNYAFYVFDQLPSDKVIEALYEEFISA